MFNHFGKKVLRKVVYYASSHGVDVHAKIWHIRLGHITKLARESTLGILVVMIKHMCESNLIYKNNLENYLAKELKPNARYEQSILTLVVK